MSRVFVLFLQAAALAAQTTEVDQLLRRVDELEAQNRQIAAALQEVKAKLAALESGPARPIPPVRAAEPTQWPEIADRDRRLKLYGFIRLDLDIDSQTPNSAQTPLFVTTPDPRQSNVARSFSMHPRLSRFGLDYSGPKLESLGAPDLFGKIEVDFENGGSESRQIIRIRHAYLQSRWGAFSLLAGQTWDIFSPLFPTVNNDTLMWNAGNVGDRRPQLRAAYEPKMGRGQWSFEGGIGLMSAIDASDMDANGFRDGEQSGRPNLQWRVGYSRSLWTDQPVRFGASAFYGWLKVAHPMFNRTMFHSQGVNLDSTLPIARAIGVRGEAWWGRNMSDFRGGAGQGINLVNGREIRGRGGWSELRWKAWKGWTVSPGFTTDDPVDGDVAPGGRVRNQAFYVANRITLFPKVEAGADYLRWRTDYKGLQRGVDNRFNVFLQYGF